MENNMTHNLDLRTLVLLLVNNEMPKDRTLELIARECSVPADSLIKALSTPTKRRTVIRWDNARRDDLVNRWNSGEKPSAIAAALGITTASVYQNISSMRRSGRKDIATRRTPAFVKSTQTV